MVSPRIAPDAEGAPGPWCHRTAAATRLVTRAISEATGSAPLAVQLLAGVHVPSPQPISKLQDHCNPLTGHRTPTKPLEAPTLNFLPRGLNAAPKGRGADLNHVFSPVSFNVSVLPVFKAQSRKAARGEREPLSRFPTDAHKS